MPSKPEQRPCQLQGYVKFPRRDERRLALTLTCNNSKVSLSYKPDVDTYGAHLVVQLNQERGVMQFI